MEDPSNFAEVRDRLQYLFLKIDVWAGYVSGGQPTVEEGSSLSADDQVYQRHPPSGVVWHCIESAVDHLHLLKVAYGDFRLLHLYAPYSLLRVASDAAALAVWVLGESERVKRQARALQIVHDDAKNVCKVANAGEIHDRDAEGVIQEVMKLAPDLNVPTGALTASLDMPRILREIEPSTEMALASEILWRFASGYIHSHLWPTRRQVPGVGDDVRVRWTEIFALLADVCAKLEKSIELYECCRKA